MKKPLARIFCVLASGVFFIAEVLFETPPICTVVFDMTKIRER